jgi:hypothetical protein
MNRATTENDDVADVFVEDPDNPFAGSPMVKNNVPMASDPEVHEKLSRKGNPYINEIKYLENDIASWKNDIEFYDKEIAHISKYARTDLDRKEVERYTVAKNNALDHIKQHEESLAKLKAKESNNVPESKYYGLYNMYQDLNKWLKKEFKAEHVTDSKGLSWLKVKINPEQADEPVRAFKSVAPFLAGGGAAAAAATQRGEDERTN